MSVSNRNFIFLSLDFQTIPLPPSVILSFISRDELMKAIPRFPCGVVSWTRGGDVHVFHQDGAICFLQESDDRIARNYTQLPGLCSDDDFPQ